MTEFTCNDKGQLEAHAEQAMNMAMDMKDQVNVARFVQNKALFFMLKVIHLDLKELMERLCPKSK